MLDLFAPEQETKTKAPKSLPDIHEITQGIILSKMGIGAQEASFLVSNLGEKQLLG